MLDRTTAGFPMNIRPWGILVLKMTFGRPLWAARRVRVVCVSGAWRMSLVLR